MYSVQCTVYSVQVSNRFQTEFKQQFEKRGELSQELKTLAEDNRPAKLQLELSMIEERLKEMGINYFRQPDSNIITIKAAHVGPEIAKEFGLVPDNHHAPNWYKIVVMEHVTIEKVLPLIEGLKNRS